MITMTQLDAMTATLENDQAFQMAVESNSLVDMQMVLRAYGLDYTYETAQSLINVNL